jgi:hypothetical protein
VTRDRPASAGLSAGFDWAQDKATQSGEERVLRLRLAMTEVGPPSPSPSPSRKRDLTVCPLAQGKGKLHSRQSGGIPQCSSEVRGRRGSPRRQGQLAAGTACEQSAVRSGGTPRGSRGLQGLFMALTAAAKKRMKLTSSRSGKYAKRARLQ